MSLLNPLALIGLITLVIPVILHLLRKAKTQEREWAAMEFLLEKEHHSVKRHSIREWLLLLTRLLLLAFLILALAQPLGKLFSFRDKTPDTIFLLLDRSAEMGGATSNGKSSIEFAIEKLESELNAYNEKTRLYLIDSADLKVTPLLDAESFSLLSQTSLKGTPCSIPEMVNTALDEFESGDFGRAECWIISQSLKEVWQPHNGKWGSIQQSLQNSPKMKSVAFRHVGISKDTEEDLRLSVDSTEMDESQVNVLLNIVGQTKEKTIDLKVSLTEGETLQRQITLSEEQTLYPITLESTSSDEQGVMTGQLELPNDANLFNNTAFFASGKPRDIFTYIVSDNQDDEATKNLVRASCMESRPHQKVKWLSVSDFLLADLSKCDLLIWTATGGDASIKQKVLDYVSAGGEAIIYPHALPEKHDEGWFFSEVLEAPVNEFFTMQGWNKRDGPWKNAKSGDNLPLDLLQTVYTAKLNITGSSELAKWSNDKPALARLLIGSGKLHLITTYPHYSWSNLENLGLHLIQIQRTLTEISESNGGGYMQFLKPKGTIQDVSLIDSQAYNRIPFQSYSSLSKLEIKNLLKSHNLESKGGVAGTYKSWVTPFLWMTLLFLLAEAILQVYGIKTLNKKEVDHA